MKYTLEELMNYLVNEFRELFLEYGKRKIMITPFNSKHYEVYVDDDTKRFSDIESLLNLEVDGQPLKKILPTVNVDIA